MRLASGYERKLGVQSETTPTVDDGCTGRESLGTSEE